MFYIIAVLTARNGDVAALRTFEGKALPVMKEHGGCLIAAIELDCAADASGPHELHHITFPSRASFESYQQDARVVQLLTERNAAVSQTLVFSGSKLVPYAV